MLLSHRLLIVVALALASSVARAQRDSTDDALSRLEETLSLRSDDGVLNRDALKPLLVVSTAPAFEETRVWFPNAALSALTHAFGAASLRMCEACMGPRVYADNRRLESKIGSLSMQEVVGFDNAARGAGAPAKTAVYLDETVDGVAFRLVDIATSRIVFAQNFDPLLEETGRSEKNFRMTRELERRIRGDSLSHVFTDMGFYPGQHLSLDFAEQWGPDNANITGLTISGFDPFIGIGASYYRVIPEALNLSIGAQGILSLPRAAIEIVESATETDAGGVQDFLDPLVTGVLVLRLPLFDSNIAALATISTNGRVALGISLLNTNIFPFVP